MTEENRNYKIQTDKPGDPTLSDFQRARKRLDEMAFNSAAAGDSNPLSENSQLAAIVQQAGLHAETIAAKKVELIDSGNYSAAGVTAELEQPRAAALEQATAIRDNLIKRAEPVIDESRNFANPVHEFGPAEQATLKMFQDLPEEKRREVKRETLLGRNPDLARCLAGAPQWATGISKHDTGILTAGLTPAADSEKADALANRARQHKRAIAAVNSIIAELSVK